MGIFERGKPTQPPAPTSAPGGELTGTFTGTFTGSFVPAAGPAPTPAPSPGPTPAPTPAPAPIPAGDKIMGTYYESYDNKYPITAVPTIEFNVVYIFHAVPQGSDGTFFFEQYWNTSPQQIQEVRSRGQKAILTVGGAGKGFNFTDRTKSQNFVRSFQIMYNEMGGVDGCDFNNYEANIGSTPNEMIWIAQQLRASYGDDFMITSPAQPNSEDDQALIKAMNDAGVLTYVAPQYYDWVGFNDPGFISTRTNDWVVLLGDASKVAVGFSANYPNGPSQEDCIREWNTIKAKHPTIRGMFCWSAKTLLDGGNEWGETMYALL